MLKAKEEMEKLKKINQGATEYLKQQKADLVQGKLNKAIQGFTINDQAGQSAQQSLKNKRAVPEDASALFDAEGLQDMLKQLVSEYKLLVEDGKQASQNLLIGEEMKYKATNGLNDVLRQKKLVLKNGMLEPQRDPEQVVYLQDVDT